MRLATLGYWVAANAVLMAVTPLAGADAPAAPTAAVPAKVDAPYDESRWAIVIGVSHYPNSAAVLPDLRGPSNDARQLSAALINRGRFNPKHVIVVAEGTPLPPTRGIILQQLATVADNVKDGLLLLFFAGHGIGIEGEAYLLPSDVLKADQPESSLFQGSAIPVSFVRKTIEEARVGQVVLMLDSCRVNPRSQRPRSRSVTLVSNSAEFQRAFIWNNTVTIFSTQTGMEAFETGRDPSVGYFADALSRALMGEEGGAINNSGEVTVGTLMDYLPDAVDRRVQREIPGHRQRPQVLSNTATKIALTFPGLEGKEPPPLPAYVRLRLPRQALKSAGLTVTRNFFSVTPATLEESIPVDPGKQFLEVKLPGYRDWSQEVEVPSGEANVDVKLEPRRSLLVAAVAAGAVGAGALVTGLAFGARAGNLADEVSRNCASGCRWTEDGWDVKDADGRRAQTLSRVFVVAGVALLAAGAGTAAYHYLSRPTLLPEGRDLSVLPANDGIRLAFEDRW